MKIERICTATTAAHWMSFEKTIAALWFTHDLLYSCQHPRIFHDVSSPVRQHRSNHPCRRSGSTWCSARTMERKMGADGQGRFKKRMRLVQRQGFDRACPPPRHPPRPFAQSPLNASAATMAMATDIACKPMIKTMMGMTLPPVTNASVGFSIDDSSKSSGRTRVRRL